MTELDNAYAAVMRQMVDSGTAPHFTELAQELDVPIERGRELLHEIMAVTPGWTHPGTDYVASFPPFNLQPTQYKISIDGKHGWYGQ